MSIFGIFILSFIFLYFGTSAAYVSFCYYKFQRSQKKNAVVKQTTSSFFVRNGEKFTSSISIRLSERNQRHFVSKNDLAIVIDCSSSMYGKALEQAKWGACEFVKNSNLTFDGVQMGVASFNQNASIISELSSVSHTVMGAIKNMPEGNGGTSIIEGLKAGLGILEKSDRKNDFELNRSLVLLTDGGDSDPETKRIATEIKKKGIQIFCIGIGGMNEGLLKEISGEVGDAGANNFFYTADPEQLVKLFDEIREIIVSASGENGEIQLSLNSDAVDFSGGETDHLLSNTSPFTWQLPWIKEHEEKIRFSLTAVNCIGMHLINDVEPKLKYTLVSDEGRQSAEETSDSKPLILIAPFSPVWLWAILIHPFFWPVYRKLFAKQTADISFIPEPPKIHEFISDEAIPPETGETQKWNPTLCVALGGGGIETALRLKAYASDASGGFFPKDDINFIFIDSHDHSEFPLSFGPSQMDNESVICPGEDLYKTHLSATDKNRDFPWYSFRVNEDLDHELFDTRNGANRNRLLGRLSLHAFMRKDKQNVRAMIEKKIEWLAAKGSKHPQVLVFCTSSGGTGSAIFQDITHLLLSCMEQKKIENQPVKVIIPDVLPDHTSTIYGKTASTIYNANRAAFLLELERIKSTISYQKDIADYPDASMLAVRRFSDAEFWVQGNTHTDKEGFSSSASLALCFASAIGDFNEKNSGGISLAKKKSASTLSPICTAIESSHKPITLLKDYCESKFILYLLEKELGIKLRNGMFHTESILAQDIEPVIELLFNNKEHPVYQTIKADIPILFHFIPGLSRQGGGGRTSTLVTGMLKVCPDWDSGQFVRLNSMLAVSRMLEWTFRILNDGDTGTRLATAISAIKEVGNFFYAAIQIIRGQGLQELREDEVLFFTEGRLKILNRLMGNYRNISQVILNYLNSWSDALCEGFPEQTQLHRNYVGIARRYARRIELIRERMKDYLTGDQKVDFYIKKGDEIFNSRLEALGERKIQKIGKYIQWRIYDKTLLKYIEEQPVLALSDNPFRLLFCLGENDRKEIQRPGYEQNIIEESLWYMARLCSPWISNEDIHLSEPEEPLPNLRDKEHLSMEVGTTGENSISSFVMESSVIKSSMCFNSDFRKSQLYHSLESTDPFLRGQRRHVYRPDIRSAMFQRIVAANNRPLQPPCLPVVVYLMEDIHRLQRLIYLHLEDKVNINLYKDSARKAITVKTKDVANIEKTFYLTGPQDHPDHYDGAVRFVLLGTCAYSDEEIPVSDDWRPSVADIELLGEADKKMLPDFLESFRLVINVMIESKNGYISPIGEITSHFNKLTDSYK